MKKKGEKKKKRKKRGGGGGGGWGERQTNQARFSRHLRNILPVSL